MNATYATLSTVTHNTADPAYGISAWPDTDEIYARLAALVKQPIRPPFAAKTWRRCSSISTKDAGNRGNFRKERRKSFPEACSTISPSISVPAGDRRR